MKNIFLVTLKSSGKNTSFILWYVTLKQKKNLVKMSSRLGWYDVMDDSSDFAKCKAVGFVLGQGKRDREPIHSRKSVLHFFCNLESKTAKYTAQVAPNVVFSDFKIVKTQ